MMSFASFVINSVFIYPVTKQILSSQRVSQLWARKALAMCFLAVTLFGIFFYNLNDFDQGENAFMILGVSRSASPADIKKAYRTLAVQLHPDKNSEDPDAEASFIRLKEAYDKLLNDEYRQTYDKWGDQGVKWQEKNMDITMNGSIQMLIAYVAYVCMTFFVTLTASHTNARSISLACLGLLASLEGNMRFGDVQFTVPYFTWLALYQQIDLLRQMYFTLVAGIVAFENLTYVDETMKAVEIVKLIAMQNKSLIDRVVQMDHELRITGKADGLSKKSAGIGTTKNIHTTNPAANLPRNLQNKVSGQPQPSAKPTRQIPQWAIMIAMYFLINYLSK